MAAWRRELREVKVLGPLLGLGKALRFGRRVESFLHNTYRSAVCAWVDFLLKNSKLGSAGSVRIARRFFFFFEATLSFARPLPFGKGGVKIFLWL